ncbi:MAG TPA: ABC transporter permease [Bacillota bacterium]
MHRYILRRLVLAVPTALLAVTLIFIVMRVLPGDPALAALGEQASQRALEAFRQKMGLDQPLWRQYLDYMGDLLRGELGESMHSGQPVLERILSLFPYTLELTVAAVLIGAVIGIPLGVTSAVRRGSWVDSLSRLLALVGISFPAFYLGILLLLLFSLKLGWFPSVGVGDEGVTFVERLQFLVLPALSLGLIESALTMRITRSSMLDVIQQDYIRTARAKGLAERVVLYKHAIRNALIPITTVIGLNLTTIISGAVLTETVFTRPGLGNMLVKALTTRDYTVVQGTVVLFAILVIIINLLVDLTYGLIDPRVRYD